MNKVHKGNGFQIVEDDDVITISWMVWGHMAKEVSYKISHENMIKALKSDEDAYEVKFFAETGKWTPTEAEKLESRKDFLRRRASLLIKIPENQELFKDDKEELDILLKKGREMIEKGED